ncbi:hypothetical protein N42HA_02290 [Lactococcus lactis]|nr:hypothetical protein [Lactococcus lactis]
MNVQIKLESSTTTGTQKIKLTVLVFLQKAQQDLLCFLFLAKKTLVKFGIIGNEDNSVGPETVMILIYIKSNIKSFILGREGVFLPEKLIKSKERVQKHGEVFTPNWMVQKMLDVEGVREACEDIYATFLEPSAGDGNFLTAILERKLKAVINQFSKSSWKTKSLFALASIYGIEFLEDNLELARSRMIIYYLEWFEQTFDERLSVKNEIYKSANYIIKKNIVRGNTLTKRHPDLETPIVFTEWNRVEGSKSDVEVIEFQFAELFNEGELLELGIAEGQVSLFDFDGDGIEDIEFKGANEPAKINIREVYKLGE